MDLKDMPPHTLCFELDRVCAPYYFTYSGIEQNRVTALHVYPSAKNCNRSRDEITRFYIDEDNPLEYVLTKILLQFGGGA